MSFSTRNSFYLRISRTTVLPVYIYLDERHVKWMSDRVLQHVLSDLRPQILSKLKAETDPLTGGALNGKKATVDTHRGDTYQFCYFIRKTEQHSVAIKSRNFRAIPQQEQTRYISKPSLKSRGKRKKVAAADAPTTTAKTKKRKTHNEAAAGSESTSADVVDVDMDELSTNDVEEQSSESRVDSAEMGAAARTAIDLDVDSEEEKPKPVLNLTYQGFNIYGHCLYVVVEPWPVIRSMTTSLSNSKRKAGPAQRTSRPRDERSPLFLSEDLEEDDERTSTTEISDRDSDSDGTGGMIEFSQVLHSIGDSRAGAANDDEDMDGSVLFGDADELREL